jgi:hypothetical protein
MAKHKKGIWGAGTNMSLLDHLQLWRAKKWAKKFVAVSEKQ